MEYLPEKKRTQQVQIRKKEAKLMDFRQYLADNEVVLAMTKCTFPALNFNPYHILTYLLVLFSIYLVSFVFMLYNFTDYYIEALTSEVQYAIK